MKLTTQILKKLIKEELESVVREDRTYEIDQDRKYLGSPEAQKASDDLLNRAGINPKTGEQYSKAGEKKDTENEPGRQMLNVDQTYLENAQEVRDHLIKLMNNNTDKLKAKGAQDKAIEGAIASLGSGDVTNQNIDTVNSAIAKAEGYLGAVGVDTELPKKKGFFSRFFKEE